MRAVLITLSGDADIGRAAVLDRYSQAEIIDVPRAMLEAGSFERLKRVRALRPEIFAVMTEAIAWQYGQDALMLFGSLAGARESVIVDARGGIRSGTRIDLLAKAPARIARCVARGKIAVRRAVRELGRLEEAVQTGSLKPDRKQSGKSISIAYLRGTPAAGTQPGGATSHINGVVNGLLSKEADVKFISNDEIAGLRKADVDFHLIAPDAGVMPRSAFDMHNGAAFSRGATELIASSPPDFIYQRYCRFSWAGVEASLRAGVPFFLEYNGSEVWIGTHWDRTERLDLLERCERLNLAAATKIFVISQVEKNNLLAAGIADDKIIVNPNGVDADEFRPGIGGREARKKLGIADGAMLAGFVGSFGPWHGVLALADAIALTPKEVNIHFVLIGDGSLRHDVENKLLATGDISRVTFTGVVKHDRVPVLLDACDILISPHVPLADGSEFFGSPTKLFEYMAMGKGIVASRLGQIGEVIADGQTALLVEPGDAAQLSAAIVQLVKSRELSERLGSAARRAAIAKHTWKQNAANILDAYQGLCD